MRILIVDDHILFRDGLCSLFDRQPDFQVVGEAGSVEEAVQKALELKPELVLMDFSLGDGTGLDATDEILSQLPDTKIVFLTMHEQDDRLFAAIRHGAKGYLLKNLPVARLLASLRALEQGEAPISPVMTAHILEEFARQGQRPQSDTKMLAQLTNRELEVFQALASGASNQEIAKELVISENTVKNHVHSILEKLNLSSRRDIVQLAANHQSR
jgi:DNA-binding NarL/FixJ family response regulator